ncbi:MAG TPA: hypothetical protein VGN17_02770 [Bryobacteraceae bacterium]|jgi:hypothetical protein
MSNRQITKAQAASIADLSEKSIERAISAGQLPAKRQHGHVLLAEANLRNWIDFRNARGWRGKPLTAELISQAPSTHRDSHD